MKYFSEILNKTFDSIKELESAELAEQKKKEEEAVALEKVSNEKKAMAKKVEEAEEALKEAYNKYDLAKENAKKIIEEANLEIAELLKPAETAIKEAQENKYKAVDAFCKKYGKYSAVYTGDQAFREMERMRKYMDSIFNNFWF